VYKVFLQPKADKTYKKMKKKAKIRFQAVTESLTGLSEDPKNETIPLKDVEFYGFRRAKTDDDRIIFQICDDCRANKTIMKLRQCIDCEDIPDNGIKVFEIQLRKDAYKTSNN
jgi:mRNA-degrading endonuclease RelE of RelBE toxin-antitoxin system